MERKDVAKALEELKKQPKRKFAQSIDLIINLKNFSVKSNPLDFFVSLPHPRGKEVKVAAFVDRGLAEQAAGHCNLAVREDNFQDYAEKAKLKKLAQGHEYFIAQANLMPKVAAAFGKALGIRGKMPNPKLGCVVPPNANLQPLVEKLRKTVRLQAKKGLNLQCLVGKESQPEEEIITNVLAVYQATMKQLPNEFQNVRDVLLKLTMGKPVKIV